MHHIKKILTFTTLCLYSFLAYSQDEQYTEFYNARLYSYIKNEFVTPIQPNAIENTPIIISDTIINDYFTTGKTRKLVTQINKNGTNITIIETWTTKNPSYMTLRNAILVTAITSAAFGSGILFYNKFYSLDLQSNKTIGIKSEQKKPQEDFEQPTIVKSITTNSDESPEIIELDNQFETIQESSEPIVSEHIAPEPLPQDIATTSAYTDTKDSNQSEQVKPLNQEIVTETKNSTDSTDTKQNNSSNRPSILSFPLVMEWVKLKYSDDELSAEQIQRKNEIEINPEFKKQVRLFSQTITTPIDFDAPDNKKCSLCTDLREAYGRTAEENKTPNYFD